MKRSRSSTTSGSVLVSATISAAVLSVLVAGYLAGLGNEYRLNFRSHSYNQALHLAEAAVEHGFAELNYYQFQGGTGFAAARGWSDLGGGAHEKVVTGFTHGNGEVVGDLEVTVSGIGTRHPQIFGMGTADATATGPNIYRAIRVVLSPSSKFPMGLVARQRMDFNGNRIYSDSFDSTDEAKSTGALYDTAKRQPHGDIASNGAIVDTVTMGNADIYGTVSTGIGGTIAMGPQGSVGPTFAEADRADTTAAGESAGWIRHDFYVDVPSVTLPGGLTSAPNPPSGAVINNNTTLTTGDWRADAITLRNTKTLTITGTVRIYVTGNIDITGTGAGIIIAPGGKLEVYVGGSVQIAGSGVVNQSGVAANNQFYGLPSSTSWSVSGNGNWIGTIYAPQANLTLNGGGTNGDFSGGVVANNITLDGITHFHYDESLKDNLTVSAGYVVSSWQALQPNGTGWVIEN